MAANIVKLPVPFSAGHGFLYFRSAFRATPFRCCSYISAFEGEVKSSGDLHQKNVCVHILHLNSSGADERSWTGIASKTFLTAYKSNNDNHIIKEINLWDKELLQYDLSHVGSKMRMVSGEDIKPGHYGMYSII